MAMIVCSMGSSTQSLEAAVPEMARKAGALAPA